MTGSTYKISSFISLTIIFTSVYIFSLLFYIFLLIAISTLSSVFKVVIHSFIQCPCLTGPPVATNTQAT
jgi:hypothetical protein